MSSSVPQVLGLEARGESFVHSFSVVLAIFFAAQIGKNRR
jgi:hypothetical protein